MKKRSVFERMAEAPYLVWSVMFILAPLLFVAYFAFTDRNGDFTLENITSLSAYSNTFVMSLGFALIATAICLLIGYPLAYFMSRQSPRAQKILMVLIMLPMWCNLLIRTYALMALLDNGGLITSLLERMGLGRIPIVGTNFGVVSCTQTIADKYLVILGNTQFVEVALVGVTRCEIDTLNAHSPHMVYGVTTCTTDTHYHNKSRIPL